MILKISKSILRPAAIIAGLFIFSAQAQTVKQLTSKKSAKKNEDAIAAAQLLSGQELHIHSLGIGIGQTLLMSDLEENGEDKITAELFYNYKASYSFDFYANLHYSKHELEEKGTYSKIGGLVLGAKGKLFHYDAFQPFVGGGLGFFRPQIKKETYKSKGKTVFGYQAVAGADFDLNRKISVGGMFIFNNPFDVEQESTADVEGYYFKMLLTAFYKF